MSVLFAVLFCVCAFNAYRLADYKRGTFGWYIHHLNGMSACLMMLTWFAVPPT